MYTSKTDREILAQLNDHEQVLCDGNRRYTAAVKLINSGVAKIVNRLSYNTVVIAKANDR